VDVRPIVRDIRDVAASGRWSVGGDQASGLAMAIGIVMVLMVLGAVALFAFATRVLTPKLAPPRRRLVTLLMALVGAGIGWLLVMATFYESSWSPPPRLQLATAPGFDAPVIVLLEDSRAPGAIEWRGGGLPFTTATAEISVPPTGIVRVRSFGAMAGRMDLDAIWPDGRRSPGAGGGPGPPGTGAFAYLAVEHPDAPPPGMLLMADPPAIAAYIAQRERRR
jgi:hypothetical protein